MKLNTRFLAITSLIILAVLTRLIPHPFNFTAIFAVALFGASQYNNKLLAFLVPALALILSDLLLGSAFYPGWEWVYGTYILTIFIGFFLRKKVTVTGIVLTSVISSLCFYIFTDIPVFLGTLYPHTQAGLVTCYVAALPFLRNALLSDLFYSGLLFGTFYLAQLKFPALLKQRIQ